MCDSMKSLFSGMSTPCPTLTGPKPYVYLDNGASTPSLQCVSEAVQKYIPYYSSVHRGTGFKSLLSTHLFEKTRTAVLAFVNASPLEHCCIFTRNTTESINKLARRFPYSTRNIVLTTTMEHHADDLPWRGSLNKRMLMKAYAPHTVHVEVLEDGQLDMVDFERKLCLYRGRIALVAVTGASNVTGFMNPIHEIARMAHAEGAQMYAPFGTGVLVGRLDTFNQGEPDLRGTTNPTKLTQGGGAVSLVTLDKVIWAPAPDRDEAGSPNIPGAVALLAAITLLKKVTMSAIATHESLLTSYALKKLSRIPGIRIFGDQDPTRTNTRVGVIPFSIERMNPELVAAILGYEFGVGVRSGCFCAHPLIGKLLGVSEYLLNEYSCKIEKGETPDKPGLIRVNLPFIVSQEVSFGMYNDEEDVDKLVDALEKIVRGEYFGRFEKKCEGYVPVGWTDACFDDYVDVEKIVDEGFQGFGKSGVKVYEGVMKKDLRGNARSSFRSCETIIDEGVSLSNLKLQ